MSEFEPEQQATIQRATLDDVEGYRGVQSRGWIDTYPNEAEGVSIEWVQTRAEGWMTPEALTDSKERLAKILEDPIRQPLFVARVGDSVIGMVHATTLDGIQRLEALYVDSAYRGKGVAQQLIDRVFQQIDPSLPVELEAVSYNDRAIRFYQKNGFEIIPGSEHLFKDVMPSIKMTRQGDPS